MIRSRLEQEAQDHRHGSRSTYITKCQTLLMSKRLQVPYLKVKDTRVGQKQSGNCVVALTNLLGCWASNGEGVEQCKHLEQELKQCMLGRKYVKAKRSTVNYHSNRLLGKVNPKPHD